MFNWHFKRQKYVHGQKIHRKIEKCFNHNRIRPKPQKLHKKQAHGESENKNIERA